jgi:hypothetical protein
MTPIESAAVRTSIATLAAFALFILVSYLIYPGDAQEKLRVFSAIADPAVLATLGPAAIGVFALQIRGGTRSTPANLAVRFARAAIEVLLISLTIVAIHECLSAGLRGGFVPWQFSPRYQLRMLEAMIFTVTVIRLALPLLPRFDRMSSHRPEATHDRPYR